MKNKTRKIKVTNKMITSIIVVTIVFLIWYFFTLDQTPKEKLIFPGLSSLAKVLTNNFSSIMSFSFTTWYRVLVGLLIGSLVGFSVGLLMTWFRVIEYFLDPFIELIRPIPPIALTPFFILWFGLGDMGQLLLVSLGCFMVIVVTTVVAVRNTSPIYVRAAKSLGANSLQVYKTIFIPAIMPNIASAIRVASATGFGLTVAAEYLGAQGGLGYMIRNARVTLQTESILLAAILLGIESLITDQFLRIIFNRITQWVPKENSN